MDTNFSQLSKLPREYLRVDFYSHVQHLTSSVLSGFAEFGKISGNAPSTAAAPVEAGASQATPAAVSAGPADPSDPSWKPTRRVRAAPGGAQTFSFGGDPEPVNAAAAPAPPVATQAPEPPTPAPAPAAQAPQPDAEPPSEYRVVDNDGVSHRPSAEHMALT